MSHSYRGWKSGIRVWAWLGEASLPACRLLLTSRCIFTQWKEHEISLKSFITVPLSWFKQPAKAAPTNTITFGNERFNMWTWGAVNTNIQTLAMGINNTLFLYYSLNACRICNDVAYFIPGIFNLYFTLFVLTSLVWGVNKCIDSWKESAFGFIYFLFFLLCFYFFQIYWDVVDILCMFKVNNLLIGYTHLFQNDYHHSLN